MIDWKKVPSGALLQIAEDALDRCTDVAENVRQYLESNAGTYVKVMSNSDDGVSLSGVYAFKIPYEAFDCSLYSGVQVVFDEDADPEYRGKVVTIDRINYAGQVVVREFSDKAFPPEFFSFSEDYDGTIIDELQVEKEPIAPSVFEKPQTKVDPPKVVAKKDDKPGHDAVEFLDRFLAYHRAENLYDHRKWSWNSSGDGRTIYMQYLVRDVRHLIDRSVAKVDDTPTSFVGIDLLKSRLQGKRIESLDCANQWYLKVLDDEVAQVEPKIASQLKTEEDRFTKKLPGYDPIEFLDKFIRWNKTSGWTSDDRWSWSFSKDGKVVDMQADSLDRLPDRLIHESNVKIHFSRAHSGTGIAALKQALSGKRIVSCRDKKGHWYLKIVGQDLSRTETLNDYLNKFFRYADDENFNNKSNGWYWSITFDGKFVDMMIEPNLVSQFVESTLPGRLPWRKKAKGRGKDELLRALPRNVRVRGVEFGGRFVLQLFYD